MLILRRCGPARLIGRSEAPDAVAGGGRSRVTARHPAGRFSTSWAASSTSSRRPAWGRGSGGCWRRRGRRTSATGSAWPPGRCSWRRRPATPCSSPWPRCSSGCRGCCSGCGPGRSPTGSTAGCWWSWPTCCGPSSSRCCASAIVTGWVDVTVVLVTMFLFGVAEVFADSASGTLLPMLVPREDLGIGNARLQAGFLTTNQLVGPPVGAFLFAVGTVWPFVGAGALRGARGAARGADRDPARGAARPRGHPRAPRHRRRAALDQAATRRCARWRWSSSRST